MASGRRALRRCLLLYSASQAERHENLSCRVRSARLTSRRVPLLRARSGEIPPIPHELDPGRHCTRCGGPHVEPCPRAGFTAKQRLESLGLDKCVAPSLLRWNRLAPLSPGALRTCSHRRPAPRLLPRRTFFGKQYAAHDLPGVRDGNDQRLMKWRDVKWPGEGLDIARWLPIYADGIREPEPLRRARGRRALGADGHCRRAVTQRRRLSAALAHF